MRSLQDYTITCDQEKMNQCLTDVTREMALSLKRQHGNAYGFGDDDCSEDRILMNLPDELLDDPDAVHSKPVENFLGNLDRHVAKTGPQGFDKVTDDLLLKYGKKLIKKKSFEWRSNENKQAAENLKVIQSLFDTKQQTLRTAGVSDSDIAT